jgi:hypothetical protein
MITKEYVQDVAGIESTHFIIYKKNEIEQVVVGSFVIMEDEEVKETLATDGYLPKDTFNLTDEEWQELSE